MKKSAILATGAAKPLRAVAKCAVVLTTLALLIGTASADYVATPESSTWSPTDGPVYAIERIGTTIYIGGGFTTLRSPDGKQTAQRNRLAAFDARTGTLLSWNPGAMVERVVRNDEARGSSPLTSTKSLGALVLAVGASSGAAADVLTHGKSSPHAGVFTPS